MRILFVVKSKAIENLGVMYLSAVVKQAGHEARIVSIDQPDEIVKWKPEIVGYSIMTGDMEKFRQLNDELKSRFNFTSIVGGPDPTFFPQGYEWADAIVDGEGEQVMADLLQSGNQYPNIDIFPWPDRTDFPGRKIRDFIASRGCANSCSYCYNSAWNKMFPELAKVRTREVRDVIDELASIQDAEFFYAQDSCFGISMKWMRAFSELYRKKINLPYHVHLRPNMVNEERAILLHDSGCVSVKIALETASSRLRKLINRGNQKNEDAYVAARLLKKWNIALIMQNILGLPSATIEDDLETLEVNVKCKPSYAWVSIFQPYPATELAKYCEKEKIYTGDYSEIGDNFFDKSVLNISDKQKEQVAVLQRVFAFCVEMQVMPKVEDLSWERLPKFVHNTMRRVGDRRMFPDII
jgi:radical SAM superfamily enzyme YgiQ (UPF0313 family)